ncbi:hypothetical protein ACP4OV_006302 [Aristida adscensionis]
MHSRAISIYTGNLLSLEWTQPTNSEGARKRYCAGSIMFNGSLDFREHVAPDMGIRIPVEKKLSNCQWKPVEDKFGQEAGVLLVQGKEVNKKVMCDGAERIREVPEDPSDVKCRWMTGLCQIELLCALSDAFLSLMFRKSRG